MSAMLQINFHEVNDRMFYSTRWRHSLFVLYDIKNIFCHLKCKINLNILENAILFWSRRFRSKVTIVYHCTVLFNDHWKKIFWIIKNFSMILKPKFSYKYLTKFFIIKRDDYRHLCFYTIWTREIGIRNNLRNLFRQTIILAVRTKICLKMYFFGRYFCYRAGKRKQIIFMVGLRMQTSSVRWP